MLKRLGLAVACILPALIGCQDSGTDTNSPSNEAVGVTMEPIIGGVPATGYPEAALLDMVAANGAGYACSATLIAPKVVLTAGHCVDGMTSFNVYVGTTMRPGIGGETYDWHENGATNVNPSHHDVGVVYLQDAITLTSYPTLASSAVADGTGVLNVGRILNDKLTYSLYQAGTNIKSAAAIGFQYDYYSPDIIEHGDSGGPVFISGTHTIVAVNSGANTSANIQVLARVNLLYSWIQDRIASHGGTGITQGSGGAANHAGSGGAAATGGVKATGGTKATGGSPSTGGAKATGGNPSTGGAKTTGGTKATGGNPSTGSAKVTGGAAATGGAKTTGGASSKSCSNEVEPNNDYAHATTLSGLLCGSLSTTTDTDWYKLNVDATLKTIAMTADKDATFGVGYVVGGGCVLSMTGLRQVQVQAVGATVTICVAVSSASKAVQSYTVGVTP